jgi:para-nitrobenzyl esterase
MNHAVRIAASLSLAATLSVGIARAADAPSAGLDGPPAFAQTTSGRIRGNAGEISTFKGIPFAAPPVGPLRFAPPQPATAWAGTRDATAFGPQCVQAGPPGAPMPPMSEDCLTANVYTRASAHADAPVIVYIYGGGYAVGSSSQAVFDGTALARHGVVVVTFNYRLNVFGFLAHPALSAESPAHTSGNYGILDMVAALRWVHDNARNFGGDPNNVTIMGESAGAGAVSALMTMPQTKGLYRRAIMQSAPVFRPELTLPQAETAGVKFADGATLTALRAMPAADLLRRVPNLDPDTRSDLPITYGPIADGVVLPDERTAYATGTENVVPIIIGNNLSEGSFFAPRGMTVKTLDAYAAALQRRFGANADRARALYPAATDADALPAEATIVGDLDINTGVRKMAVAMAKREPDVYRYLFSRARAGVPPGHSAELPYVFGTPAVNGLGGPAPAFDATDSALSETMMTMWTQFAKTGNPNAPGTNAWPRYTPAGDRFIVFGDTVTTGTAFRTAQLDFLNTSVGR